MSIRNLISLVFLCLTSVRLLAFAPGSYASESRLAGGRWVKIAVDTTGIYQLDYETIRRWGFPNPSQVTVHGFGASYGADNTFQHNADDLPPTHTLHTPDGRILFFGEGPVAATLSPSSASTAIVSRNYYSDRSYYFLTDRLEQQPTPEHPFVANSSAARRYASVLDFREKEVCNYSGGGALFDGPNVVGGGSDEYCFRVRNLCSEGVTVRMVGISHTYMASRVNVGFAGGFGSVDRNYVAVQPVVSDHKVWSSFQGLFDLFPSDEFPMQDAMVKVTLSVPNNFPGSIAAVNHLYFIYDRRLRLDPDEKALFTYFYRQNIKNQNLVYENAPEGLQVWDVTYSWDVRPYQLRRSGSEVAINLPQRLTPTTRMVAFDSQKTFPKPKFVGEVANQNLHALTVPEMVIVTTEPFLPSAQELAQIHREHGMDVHVVLQNQIFNEFGSGAPSAAAIRRLNKMFHDRDASKFRFMTIYGPATWDPRGRTGQHPDWPLTYLAEEATHAQDESANFSNDIYFGLLADGSQTSLIYRTKANIAVGRIPARSLADATAYNAKVRAILDSRAAPEVYLKAVTTSCEGDDYAHYDHNSDLCDTLLAVNPFMTIRRADELMFPLRKEGKDTDGRRSIAEGLKHGAGLFSYCGHGTPQGLGNFQWDLRANNNLTYTHFPLALLATCNLAPFDRFAGLGERMIFKANGGMAAVIAACRDVFLDRNKVLSYAIAAAYGSATPGTTMGEVFSNARNVLIERGMTPQLGANSLCYNFIGDPSLPLSIPEGTIVVEKPQLAIWQPGSIVELSGYVADSRNSILTGFQGEARIDIYRAPAPILTVMQDGIQHNTQLDHTILTSTTGTIRNGRFKANITVPTTDIPGKPGRIIITAVDSTTGRPVAGILNDITISDTPAADTDRPASPQITELQVDRREAVIKFSAPALIADPQTAHMPVASLRLDGRLLDNQWTAQLISDSEGNYECIVELPPMAPGHHTLALSVNDLLNRNAFASIDFNYTPERTPAVLTLESDENFVRSEAIFTLSDPDAQGRLIITDSTGTTVLSDPTPTFPYTWNPTTPNGHYRATYLTTTHTIPPINFVIAK